MSGIGNTIQGPTTNPSLEWQISDVLSKSAGRHLLKMGGEFRRGVDDFDLGFFFVGRFVFNGTYTGDSFADFLLGRAVEFNHAKGRTKLAMRNQNFGAFFQDDIKVRDNLTLNLGVRYDFYSPITDALGQTSTFVVRQPDNGTPQSGVAEVIIAGHQRAARELDLFPGQEQRPAQGRLRVGHLRRRPPGAARRRRRVSQPAAQQPGAAAHPVLPVPGAAGLPRHDARESDQSGRGQPDHRPALLDRPGHRDAVYGRLQRRNAVAVRQEHGGRGGVRAERRQGPPAVPGDEPAVLRRRPDDRAQQGSLPAVSRLQLGAAIDQLGPLRLQGARDEHPAPVQQRPGVRGVLHAGDLARPVVGIPFRGDQHHVSAETAGQRQPRRPTMRASDFDARHRFTASEIWELPFGAGRRWLKDGRAVARAWRMDGGEPVDVPERIPVQRLRRRRSLPARGRLHRVVPAESGRRSRQPARGRRRSGSTPAPTPAPRPASSAAHRATRSAAPAW